MDEQTNEIDRLKKALTKAEGDYWFYHDHCDRAEQAVYDHFTVLGRKFNRCGTFYGDMIDLLPEELLRLRTENARLTAEVERLTSFSMQLALQKAFLGGFCNQFLEEFDPEVTQDTVEKLRDSVERLCGKAKRAVEQVKALDEEQ
jgi:hypothetical protein